MAPTGTPDFSGAAVSDARAEAQWLDAHFEGCEAEYRALLDTVGIKSGDRVLDLGCGNGRFLELIRAQTCAAIGVDLSPAMLRLAHAGGYADAVPLVAAAATALPFRAASFDVAWCSNVFEYLNAEQQVRCLRELRRVVRPDGTIAVKDSEWAHKLFHPVPLEFWQRYLYVMAASGMPDAFVGRLIPGSFRRAGLEPTVRTVLTERTAPLSEAERRWIALSAGAVAADARAWLGLDAATEIDDFARRFTPGADGCVLDAPDFYYCEGNILVTARVPSAGEA
jgi:ubiquinone/menaquinone biosynthesis C-methylase UbiE